MGRTCLLCVYIFLGGLCNVLCIVKESQSYGVGKLTYCNSKYFSYCNVVTAPRVVNGVERLFTNHSFTNLFPVGNNFTAAGVFVSHKGVRYKIEHKFCDYVKQLWLQTFLRTTAHLSIPCPLPPKTYHMANMELPPPFLPLAMLPGTYHLEGEVYTTVSKVRAIGIHYTIHFAANYGKKNGNKKKG